ncbi:MAG: fumarylacetoacetate hydrolase family protein [Ignavibacteria bacterium]
MNYNQLNILITDEVFLVKNVYCVGKNYAEHIEEIKDNYTRLEDELPVIFLKPNSAIVCSDSKITIPQYNGRKLATTLSYECEVVVAIGKDGFAIPEETAREYITGIGIGLDMTLRDLQTIAKQRGLPWAVSKGFIGSAPVSDILPIEYIKDPLQLKFTLAVNDIVVQDSNTNLMINNIYKLVSFISSVFSLKEGDLIFTGSPGGSGVVQGGDVLKANLNEVVNLIIYVE